MMNTNMDNLGEFESFNPMAGSVQDFLLSWSATEGYSDHHQIPSSHPGSLHQLQVPELNFDSLSNYFPQVGSGQSSHGYNNNNSFIPSSDVQSDSLQNSSPGFLLPNKADNCGARKRKRISNNNREVQKPKEVVHVRAKRGQATDSHSLAERLRREKINEKLRCLQDLVPGCYKTMGMAVMLDVIISYVRSLQNQIDFLSMKLSAASLYYDFNSDDNALGTMQGMHGFEAQGMEKMLGEGYEGVLPQPHSSWPL